MTVLPNLYKLAAPHRKK